MTDDTLQPTPERVVFETLGKFGMRLPPQYDRVGMDERIRLMALMGAHVVKALREVGYAV